VATILVVDDHSSSREFLVTLLGYQGHRLLEAADGEEALERVRSEEPDLIISDLVMPRMDGYELAFQLRSDPTIARMPIIFYTAGYGVEEAHDLAQSCGVFHMLTKPSEPEVILSNVESALRFPVPPLPCDWPGEPGEMRWVQEVQVQHHRLLINKLTQQVKLLEQEITVREWAEESVCILNAQLEERVIERTASLNKANARLQRELCLNESIRLRIEAQTKQIHQQCEVLAHQKAQLAEANARLERLASTDGLTGLKNRRTFQTCLEQEFERASRYNTALSLIVLDVDQFKRYNDTFGHPAGDVALQQVAACLEKRARLSDVVTRYGGEEFAILLPNTNREGARILAERLRETIETAQWPHRPITISLGIASLTSGIPCHAALVQAADQALYAAKQAGRNRALHYEDLAPYADLNSLCAIVREDLYEKEDRQYETIS